MKPSFALNLSHDGISLLHRAQAGWLNVGDVSLDAPDLMDELVVLRRTAADLESGGLTTKLVIPNSQILYLDVDAPGPTRADKVAQIRDALVGQTPYDPADLVFDWRQKGKITQVAVVARETLTEAETFAAQYRFNPVSFVATPKPGTFDGEPFFGPTRHAVRLLEGGETVEPDKRRIKVVGRLGEVTSIADPAPDAETAPDADEHAAQAPAANGHDSADDAGHGSVQDSGRDSGNGAVAGQTAPAQSDPSPPDAAAPPPVTFSRRAAGPADPAPEANSDPVSETPPVSFASRRQRAAAAVNGHAIQNGGKPPPLRAAETAGDDADKTPAITAKVEDLPPIPPRPAPTPEEIARRADQRLPVTPPRDAAPAAPETPPDPAPVDAGPAVDGASPPAEKKGRRFRLLGGRSKDSGSAGGEAAPRLADALARMRRSPMPEDTVPERPERDTAEIPAKSPARARANPAAIPAKELPSRRAKETSASRQLARRAPPLPAPQLNPLPKVQISGKADAAAMRAPSAPSPKAPARQDAPRPLTATEADAMTVFGARGMTPPVRRPRFVGPALAMAVLLALAVVGLWSTYFLSDFARDWFGLGGEPEVAEAEEPAPVILPEAGGIVTDGPIAGIPDAETAAVDPGIVAPEPVPGGTPDTGDTPVAAAPAEEPVQEDVPPSVPLPGIEVTDLQPETVQEPPAAPEAPAPDLIAGAPAGESALPSVLAEDAAAAPPALPAAPSALDEAQTDTVIAAAEPPAAPDLPPVVDVSPPQVDTTPPAEAVAVDPAETAPGAAEEAVADVRPDPIDEGPGPDIATIAPTPPAAGEDSPAIAGAPAPEDNPGTIDIVRLEEPPSASDQPGSIAEAPPPAVATRVAPPTPEEAQAIYERTGVAVLAPPAIDSPGLDRLNEVVLSSADVALAEPPVRGLPTADSAATTGDSLPYATLPPLPLTLEFDLDARGLVRATEAGAITPQGVVVFRGAPDLVPPLRPEPATPEEESRAPDAPDVSGTPEAEAEETGVAEAPAEETGTVEDEFALVDPASVLSDLPLLDETDLAEADERARYGGRTQAELAAILPRPRPGSETAAADARPVANVAETEAGTVPADNTPDTAVADVPVLPDASVDTAGDGIEVTMASASASDVSGASVAVTESGNDPLIDFADFVPPLRPGTEVPSGGEVDTAALATEASGTETSEPDVVAAAPEFDDASELAVAASLTPASRPAGFASIVQAALQEAAQAPPPPPAAAAAPPPQTAPTPAAVPVRTPSIPSSAAVAATATEENALRLNRVNLIGVYGSAANRRALVRLASGRYVKVQVGDRVDGGRVAAIGDGRLSYVKGGRTITLELPSG